MSRRNHRRADELRPVEIIRGYTKTVPGSVLIRAGDTWVLCTASWETGVPAWRKGKGAGWVTAEYDMLPGSTSRRKQRSREKLEGRTQEIQRLIGRSLRSVVDLEVLGENSVLIDCDVLQADGGTRTASVTGAFIALSDALRFARTQGFLASSPLHDTVAAVSVGIVGGRVLLDLDYEEDVAAAVDMNIVMTGSGGFVEVQGTAERSAFTALELNRMIRLGSRGIRQLIEVQRRSLRRRIR